MKKPVAPNKPKEPKKPSVPQKTFVKNKTEYCLGEYDLDKNFLEIVLKMKCFTLKNLHLLDLKDFTFRTESNYDYGDNFYLVYNKPVLVENENYEHDVIAYNKAWDKFPIKEEKYKEKYALYEQKLLKYEEDLKLYNKEISTIEYEQYTKLKAKFES